jgi:hypothetical protein
LDPDGPFFFKNFSMSETPGSLSEELLDSSLSVQ